MERTMIPTRKLPRSTIELSELSLGCAQLGNLYRAVSDEEARQTVEAAWSLGIRYFDTAPHYGLGLSERRVGARARPASARRVRALVEGGAPAGAGRACRRASMTEGFVVAAAYRRVWDFSRDGIRRSISDSLERLGLDSLDIVYLHDPEDHMDEVFATGYPALEELRGEGVSRSDRRRDEPHRAAERHRAQHGSWT